MSRKSTQLVRLGTEEASLFQEQVAVGRPTPRIDSMLKVTGRAVFTRDMKLPEMLRAKIVRSPFPHARIVRIDPTRAKRIPGVKVVITGKDFPALLTEETPALARDEVLYSNQGVSALAAETLSAAEEAVTAVEVDFEQLPAVFDPELALSEGTPTHITHPNETGRNNVGAHFKVRKGKIEEAFEKSDRVVENRYTTSMETHFQLEPLSFLAQPDPDGGVTLWSTSSGPHKTQAEVARYLDIDPYYVRVKVPFLGGWFGSKEESHVAAISAMLALKSGRPVKLDLSREETITATGVRHPSVIYIKDGVKREGKIIAREIRAIYNGGGYGSLSNWLLPASILGAVGVYNIPNMKIDTFRVYTNLPPGTPKRGPFGTQMTWAIESQTDRIASELGIDPVELRLKNVLHQGETNAIGERMESISHDRCILAVTNAIKWGSRNSSLGPWRSGKGVAVGVKWAYGGTYEATVKVRATGKVEVWVDVVENGQGIYTGISQIVAKEFGIPLEDVLLTPLMYGSDSVTSGIATGASGSRQLVNVGKAVLLACCDAKKRIAARAAKSLGGSAEDIEVRGGEVFVKSQPDRSLKISELFEKIEILGSRTTTSVPQGEEFAGHGRVSKPQLGELDPETGQCVGGRATQYYTNAAQAAEVSVNVDTGQIKVHRIVAAMDVGKAINLELVKSQITGSVAMGISAALGEELVISQGRISNPNLADYKVQSALDAVQIEAIVLETPYREGPYGAKGAGEASIIPTAPAIRNAVHDATGVWINGLPITAEKILDALGSRVADVS